MSNGTPSQPNGPTVEGFTAWVYGPMGVPPSVLPADSPYLQLCFDMAINLTLAASRVSGGGLDLVPSAPTSPSVYAIAVYNLGGHYLVENAPDDPDAVPPPDNAATFWSDLRTKLEIEAFSPGLINSASDQGTSAGLVIPKVFEDMTLMSLDMLKTPWGRRYQAIAGQWGPVWGIS